MELVAAIGGLSFVPASPVVGLRLLLLAAGCTWLAFLPPAASLRRVTASGGSPA